MFLRARHYCIERVKIMWISRYFVYFTIFSVIGYIYECCFCTVLKGKWENRGFLFGPVIPIYGVGGAALVGICELINIYIGNYTWWQIFLIGYFGSIILEYTTSWSLEKLFHAYWWDYSDMPFNIKGRICLPYSICFGFAAILVTYLIAPMILSLTDHISAIYMELISLIFIAMLAADIALTVSALTGFEKNIIALENTLDAHMEIFIENIQERKRSAENRILEGKNRFTVENLEKFISEERERFSRERLEHSVSAMGGLYKSALTRVKGFKNTKVQLATVEQVIITIKKHMAYKINKNK